MNKNHKGQEEEPAKKAQAEQQAAQSTPKAVQVSDQDLEKASGGFQILDLCQQRFVVDTCMCTPWFTQCKPLNVESKKKHD